jgi:hypothetical protein
MLSGLTATIPPPWRPTSRDPIHQVQSRLLYFQRGVLFVFASGKSEGKYFLDSTDLCAQLIFWVVLVPHGFNHRGDSSIHYRC